MILIAFFYLFFYYFNECSAKDIMVVTNGNNTNTCGKATNPCQTVKYAIQSSSDGDRILIDGSKGHFYLENTSYIDLQHNLTILGIVGTNPLINCTCNQNRFINLSSTSDVPNLLTINNISFINCNHVDFTAIIVKNAKLVLNAVYVNNSGIFIGFQQLSNNSTECKAIELSILNSHFENNYIIYPFYRYSIELQNCGNLKLFIFNSNITSSPILLKAKDVTVININRVTFQDQGNGVNALFVHALVSNSIIITDCNFLNFDTSYNSLLTISSSISERTNLTGLNNILILRSNFINNKCLKSHGGAISILLNGAHSTQGNIKITDCQFKTNYAKTLGGSIYALNAFKLKMNNCTFIDNRAGNGGALYLNKVSTFFAYNLTCIGNIANLGGEVFAKGGALYLSRVTSQFIYGSFYNNHATGDGDAIFAYKCLSMLIQNMYFNSSKSSLIKSPRNSLLSISTYSNSNNFSLSISNTVFDAKNCSDDTGILYAEGNIQTKNLSILCSVNNTSKCQMLKPDYPSSNYKYRVLNLWCSDVKQNKFKKQTCNL